MSERAVGVSDFVKEFLNLNPDGRRCEVIKAGVARGFKAKSVETAYDRWYKRVPEIQAQARAKSLKTVPAAAGSPKVGGGPEGPPLINPPGRPKSLPDPTSIIVTAITEAGENTNTLSMVESQVRAGLAMRPGDPTLLKIALQLEALKPKIPTQTDITEPLPFRRPAFLNPRQHEIIDNLVEASQDGAETPKLLHLLVPGGRQTGKTTAIWCGILESMVFHPGEQWHFICSNGNNARNLHYKVKSDPNLIEFRELYFQDTKTVTSLRNGSTFMCHNTTVDDVKGCTGNIWLDEFDQIVEHNPQVFAAAINLLRSSVNLRLVISCNRGGAVYEVVMNAMEEFPDRVVIIPLENTHSPHIQAAGHDAFLGKVMEAVMSEEYARAQLYNERMSTSDAFDLQTVMAAFVTHDHESNRRTESLNIGQWDDDVVIAVDPGFKHPTGVFIGAIRGGHLIEVRSHEFKGEEVGEETIKAVVAEWALETHRPSPSRPAHIVIESNSGGLHWLKHWQSLGIPVHTQNFAGDTSVLSRESFCRTARTLLSNHRVHLKNPVLQRQLATYNPSISKEKNKGDLADAFLHACWYAARVTRSGVSTSPGTTGGSSVAISRVDW